VSEATFKLELEAREIDAVMVALQSCVNVPFTPSYLMALVSKINEQGRPQLHALAIQTENANEAA
jgi:hypothetical protein